MADTAAIVRQISSIFNNKAAIFCHCFGVFDGAICLVPVHGLPATYDGPWFAQEETNRPMSKLMMNFRCFRYLRYLHGELRVTLQSILRTALDKLTLCSIGMTKPKEIVQ